jgi:3-isopropylmalate/(R)-2-methylmalate dehydratase small subunit
MSEFSWVLKGRCYKLGHDVPHPGGVIPAHFITARETDPAVLVPHLFEETDPGFHTRSRPGDIIVTGRNFGMGQKGAGYIAMQALGLGLLCESMSMQAYRAAIAEGLRVLPRCPGVLELCEQGDALEVDFLSGRMRNHTRDREDSFEPVPAALQELIEQGGNAGWLAHWQRRQAAGEAKAAA